MSQTRQMSTRKRGRVRLVPPVMAAHGQRNLRLATETLPVHIETHGALALLDVGQLDTQPVPALRPVTARCHILIVEDDSRMAGVIHAALELEGEASWLVQLASGGKHALELASTTPPDVVLLDVLLPDLDGAEVYHRLRANAQTHATRILFLSAGTSFDLFQRGIEDGVLLRKPFPMPELVSLVRALLRG